MESSSWPKIDCKVVARDVPKNDSLQQGVYNIEEVRRARDFVEKLHHGLEPSNVTLANKIENVVGKSLASVLHLKTSLPARLQSLLADVQQVRAVEGKRVVDIIERSGLKDDDVKNAQNGISQIQTHIFGEKMNALLNMVQECEEEFRKTEGGYDQCMHEQEANLCRTYNITKYIKYVYTPLKVIVAPPDLVLSGSICVSFATSLSMKHRPGLASLFFGAFGFAVATLSAKFLSLGLRSDFDQIQIEKKENLSEVRQIRSMGQQMGNHLKTIQDDIQRLQACHTRLSI